MGTDQTLEQKLCAAFRSLLVNTPNDAELRVSDDLRSAMFSLEYFVPATLAKVYPEWKRESFDGFYRVSFRKIGDLEVEFFGLCILITDQTTTPIDLRFRLHASTDTLSSLAFKVGEWSADGMVRLKWHKDAIPERLHRLAGRQNQIPWVYQVGFDEAENSGKTLIPL